MKIISKFIISLGKVRWEKIRKHLFGKEFNLTIQDWQHIESILGTGNFVILTRRKAHLSTYLINLGHFLLTFRWGYYSHVCVNLEPNESKSAEYVEILESIGSGTTVSKFEKVFDCDSVCLLRPVYSDRFNWHEAIANLRSNLNKKYDGKFNLKDDSELSCVEYILTCLKTHPEYYRMFHGLEAMIRQEGNLTPDMFYECGAFEVVFETRK